MSFTFTFKPSIRIPAFLEAISDSLVGHKWAFVATIDSSRDTGSNFRHHGYTVEEADGCAIVPASELVEICKQGKIFFGFDEVWVSTERPVACVPSQFSVVGP